jgi:hypothetical protein
MLTANTADCAHCNQGWPRMHRDYLYDGEPSKPCRASEDHVHLHTAPSNMERAHGKRPYEDRRAKPDGRR